MRVFGYKPDGSVALFDLAPGHVLPPEWSSDIKVIANEAHRLSDALTKAAGATIMHPLPGVPAVQELGLVRRRREVTDGPRN